MLEDADLRGLYFNANLRGKADFRSKALNLAGTYAPGGLNSVVGAFPVLGQILTGQRGEGVFGITFAIQGPMANPQVLVNPFSLLTPGFLREITQLSNPSTQVTPTPERPVPKRAPAAARASSAPPAPIAGAPASGGTQSDVGGSWTSGTETTGAQPAAKPQQSKK